MKAASEITWLFMDLNSYFASVEQQENPMLRHRPIAVLPTQSGHTCVIAASYEAKAYGIKTGTSVRDARNMCRDLICITAQHHKYVAYHNRIIEVFARHAPINKVCSIDEIASKLPPSKRNPYDAQKIAQNIRNDIWHSIGEHINCSIGAAPSMLLAKMASDMKKPNGYTCIAPHEIRDALSQLSLQDIPGIGRNMKKRLHKSGIYSMQDLLNTPAKHIRKIWNSVEGERLWYMLHGYDIDRPATNTVMIGHSRILPPESRSFENACDITKALLEKACTRLQRKEFFAQKITFSLGTTCHKRVTIQQSTPPSNDYFLMLDILQKNTRKIAQQSFNINDMEFRKTSVTLHELIRENDATFDIFCTNSSQKSALTTPIENLRQKYKNNVLSIGHRPRSNTEFLGTKIAFSRVPDVHEFYDAPHEKENLKNIFF